MTFPLSARPAGYVLMVSIALAACSGDSRAQPGGQAAVDAQPAPAQSVPTAPVTANALPNFAPLVETYGPAVVNVEVMQQQRTPTGFTLPQYVSTCGCSSGSP